MADKKTELSIVLSAVDHATAPIKALNAHLDAMTKPIRNLKSELGGLGEKSGFNELIGGFKGIGSAIGDLLGKVAMIGGVAAAAVAGVFHLVGEFDELGKAAARIGISVDDLAGLRDAAERAGVPVEQLDAGMSTLEVNTGKARAGIGRMVSQLSKVTTDLNPHFGAELLAHLKAAKDGVARVAVLSAAMSKLKNSADRNALALMVTGDAGMAPFLTQGPKAIQALLDHHLKLTGSLVDAAKGAAGVDESLKDLKDTTVGIKAAIVTGLSPALKILVDQLSEWFAGHREDVKTWAAQIGERLPGAVHAVIDAVKIAIADISGFVESIGGIKTVAIGLAAIMLGPLLSAIATFSMALLATPVGWFLLAIGGIALAVHELLEHLKEVKEWFFGDQFEGINKVIAAKKRGDREFSIGEVLSGQAKQADAQQDPQQATGQRQDPQQAIQTARAATDAAIATLIANRIAAANAPMQVQMVGEPQRAAIKVDFANAPKGTRVNADPSNTADVDMTLGFQMWGMP